MFAWAPESKIRNPSRYFLIILALISDYDFEWVEAFIVYDYMLSYKAYFADDKHR